MALELVIDAETLTVGDIEDLEDAKSVKSISAWLVEHAGANHAELRKLPLKDLKDAISQVGERLKGDLTIPKANGSNL